MLNDLELAINTLEQISALIKKYQCRCRNELLGQQIRTVFIASDIEPKLQKLRKEVDGGDIRYIQKEE